MGLLGGLGSLVGGIIGAGSEEEGARRALESEQKGLAAIQGTNVESANAVKQDAALRQAALASMGQMQNVSEQGGMDTQSRQAQQEALGGAAAQAAGRRNAVLENMAARGTTGGGSELAAQLAGQQQAANTGAMASGAAASDARSRALQAMGATGQLSGMQQGADLASQQALNAINSFNANQRFGKSQALAKQYNTIGGQYMDQGKQAQATATGLGGAAGNVAGSGLSMIPGAGGLGFADGGEVPIMTSPGEVVVPPPVSPERAALLVEMIRKGRSARG